MAVINRRRCCPHCPKDKFIDVPDEAVPLWRKGGSLKTGGTTSAAITMSILWTAPPAWKTMPCFWCCPRMSPEETLFREIEAADAELTPAHPAKAMARLSSVQMRRLCARYALNKKF